jgi:hypothetical protein
MLSTFYHVDLERFIATSNLCTLLERPARFLEFRPLMWVSATNAIYRTEFAVAILTLSRTAYFIQKVKLSLKIYYKDRENLKLNTVYYTTAGNNYENYKILPHLYSYVHVRYAARRSKNGSERTQTLRFGPSRRGFY